MTVPISYSSMFDSSAAFYPLVCTQRIAAPTICPCTFNTHTFNNSFSSSSNSTCTPTPASSPTSSTSLTSLFTPNLSTPSSPTNFGHQASQNQTLNIGKFSEFSNFLFNPTSLFNQHVYPLFNNSISNPIPYCHTTATASTARRFTFIPASWRQS